MALPLIFPVCQPLLWAAPESEKTIRPLHSARLSLILLLRKRTVRAPLSEAALSPAREGRNKEEVG